MEYEPEVKLELFGFSKTLLIKNFETYFKVGSRVYIKQKSKNGILESVVLKKVYRTMPNIAYGVKPVISYVDTLNRVWIEDELAYEEDAKSWYHLYWTRIKIMSKEIIKEGRVPSPY